MKSNNNNEMKAFVIAIIILLIICLIVLVKDIHPPIPRFKSKEYPVRVYLYGEQFNSYFDCDSANLNYAWKDGVKIQLKDVNQIKFN